MTIMPALETERLVVRPLALDDLPAVHCVLDIELADADFGSESPKSLDERRKWLEWTILGYEQQANLHQPPYGERAITLKQTAGLIGLCGFVPCLDFFEQLPGLLPSAISPFQSHASTEVGLFYAIQPGHQRRGYATEAARAMIHFAFHEMRLRRIVATTTYDNAGSIGVMRRLRMRIEKNPFLDPPRLQVVGILENR